MSQNEPRLSTDRMTREQFISAIGQCSQACVWFNLGASDRQAYHMTMIPVSKEELLRQFRQMPEVIYVRAEMIKGQLLCIGWNGTTGATGISLDPAQYDG